MQNGPDGNDAVRLCSAWLTRELPKWHGAMHRAAVVRIDPVRDDAEASSLTGRLPDRGAYGQPRSVRVERGRDRLNRPLFERTRWGARFRHRAKSERPSLPLFERHFRAGGDIAGSRKDDRVRPGVTLRRQPRPAGGQWLTIEREDTRA